MQEIGEELQRARMARGITWESVQRTTKIRSRYLAAMEAGRMSEVPGGDVYVRAFIRSYARAVGIPAQPLITRYDNLRAEEEARAQERAPHRGPGPLARCARLVKSYVQGTLHWFGL